MKPNAAYHSRRLLLVAAISTALSHTAAFAEDTTELEKIIVIGSKTSDLNTEASSGALGSRSILNTPFSVSTISSLDIEKLQINDLQDLFAADASVNVNGGTYGGWGETISVRGLGLDYENNFKINGLSANNFSGELPYEAFERIDLLKGATGFMYGFSAPGGIVNYTTKKPVESLLSVDVGFRSDAILSEHVDASSRFGSQSEFGARVNLVHEEGDTYMDGGSIDRNTVALALDAQLSDNVYWSMDLIHNNRNTKNMSSTLYFAGYRMDETIDVIPDTVEGSTNLAAKGSFDDQQNLIALTALKWNINNNWNAQLEYGYTENNTRWAKSVAYLTNNAGDYDVMMYDQVFDLSFKQLQGFIDGSFYTGAVKHQLVAGASYQKTSTYRNDWVFDDPEDTYVDANGNTQKVYSRYTSDLADAGNLYSRVALSYSSQIKEDLDLMWSTTQQSVFISDSIEFSPQWNLLLGLRRNEFDKGEITAYYSGRVDTYKDTSTSPTVALLYKPTDETTVYASYVESFEQGQTVGDNYVNEGEQFDPTTSKQYEVGVKLNRDTYTFTSALFRIEKAAVIATADNYLNQDGITLYQGLELSGDLLVSDEWTLHANWLMLDAEYDKLTYNDSKQGNDVAGAPDTQGSIRTSYDFNTVPGLSFNLGAKYYGKAPVNSTNTLYLPSYTLVDANISYETQVAGKNLILRGSVKNLTDKEYWASIGSSSEGLRIGAPRTIALNVKVEF